ncbi:transmembrane and immunoglobulin domain-containing protein 1 [Rhinophrynus dorsalis]
MTPSVAEAVVLETSPYARDQQSLYMGTFVSGNNFEVHASLSYVMNIIFFLVLVPLLAAHHVTAVDLMINGMVQSHILSLNVSETASLKCEVHNNTAAETLTWYRGIRQLDIKSENSVNSSHVCITPLSPEDNTVSYTCLLKSDNTVKVSVMLDVKFSPILSGETNVTVEVGKDVKLTCGVKANPQPQMIWKKNGVLVHMVKSRYEQFMTSDTFQLSISKAEKSDSGVYTCTANINEGNSTNTTALDFELVVEDKKDALPVEAIGAAVVVGALIILFAMFARRDKILKLHTSPPPGEPEEEIEEPNTQREKAEEIREPSPAPVTPPFTTSFPATSHPEEAVQGVEENNKLPEEVAERCTEENIHLPSCQIPAGNLDYADLPIQDRDDRHGGPVTGGYVGNKSQGEPVD